MSHPGAPCPTDRATEEEASELRRLADELLSLDHPGALRRAALDAHALLSLRAGLHETSVDPQDEAAKRLPSGLAIGPLSAARCTWSYLRTATFLRGLDAAIREAQRRFPARRIEVLYAGCGPLAPLAVLLLAARFAADEVAFTLLDVHRRSLEYARRIVDGFGFSRAIRAYVEADAATYRHAGEHPLHLVVTETMQRALTQEPHVAVTLNLLPQLADGGLFVPERVTVTAFHFDPLTEHTFVHANQPDEPPPTRLRIPLGDVLVLDAAHVPRLRAGFPAVHVALPEDAPRSREVMLGTRVEVFGPHVLGDYTDAITMPFTSKALAALKGAPAAVIQYAIGEEPGFRVEAVTCSGRPGSPP